MREASALRASQHLFCYQYSRLLSDVTGTSFPGKRKIRSPKSAVAPWGLLFGFAALANVLPRPVPVRTFTFGTNAGFIPFIPRNPFVPAPFATEAPDQ